MEASKHRAGGATSADVRAGGRGPAATTLVVGGLALTLALLATLSQSAKRRAGTNSVPPAIVFALAHGGETICQDAERIPSGTGAVLVSIGGGDRRSPPGLSLWLSNGGSGRASGGSAARWNGRFAVRVPLAATLRHEVLGRVCVRFHAARSARYELAGTGTAAAEGATGNGRPLPGRLHLEYLLGGDGSWWSFLPTVIRRMGLGHAWSGSSVALLAALLTFASIALAAWQLVRSDP